MAKLHRVVNPLFGKHIVNKRAPKATTSIRAHLTRRDWVKVGLEILADQGPDAVTVTLLTERLRVTKGSFYWHFESREDLLYAMLEDWKLHATARVIEKIESRSSDPRDRVRQLAHLSISSTIQEFGGGLELAVRYWARTDAKVRAAVSEVDSDRIAYLEEQFRSSNPGGDAELLAALHYSLSTALRLIFAYSEEKKRELRERSLEKIFFK